MSAGPLAVVFDTETTGLTLHPDADLEKQPRCVEFGAALLSLDDGQVVDTMNVLVNPRMAMPPDATKISGITDLDLAGAPYFVDVLPAIRDFMRRAKVSVAHNHPFDSAILRAELLRAGPAGENFPWPRRQVCTVGLYAEEWGRNPRLIELYEHVMGRPLAQTHRALDDVLALCEIIQAEGLWRIL